MGGWGLELHRVRHSRRSMPLACACMPAPPWPRAVGGVCVCSGMQQRRPWVSCLWGCVRHRVCRARGRAGGLRGRCARGSTRPLRSKKPASVQVGRQFPRGEQRVRSGRVGRGGAGAVCVCPWRWSCTKWCAVHGAARCGWTLRLPMPAWQKRAVRAGRHARVSGGTGEWRFRGALQLELVH